jgi:hypothetical protein
MNSIMWEEISQDKPRYAKPRYAKIWQPNNLLEGHANIILYDDDMILAGIMKKSIKVELLHT